MSNSTTWWFMQQPYIPVVVTLPELLRDGQFFIQADGTRWTAIECSDFNLLSRYFDGEDIKPILEQRKSCGFNLLRVWTLFDIPNIGTLTSCDYSRIPKFITLCAQYGLYVEFTAYTGINDPQHWLNLCEVSRHCEPKPLLELVNELDVNTNEPDWLGRVFKLEDYKQPQGLLSSHGSNGSETWPISPYWSYATMHFNDAFEWQRKVGHNSMEVWAGPTLANENTRYPDHSDSQIYAQDAAESAALLCAGSCFHSVRGKTSELWDDIEEICARMWGLGAASVDLQYQLGHYRHAGELEDPSILRAYQRALGDGSAWTVTIRR